MKGGAQTALAIGVGYILGRRRKMRLATMLAVGAATGGAARLGPAAIRQGARYLGKTDIAGALGPQVNEIAGTVRGELLDAARGAGAEDEAGGAGERGNGRVRREPRRAAEEPDEYEEPAGEYEEEDDEDLDEVPAGEAEEPEEDDTGEPAPGRRRTTRSPVRARVTAEDLNLDLGPLRPLPRAG